MQQPAATTLRIGAWRVDPVSCQISREGETARLEARSMRLLLCLAERAGEVVSIDELLSHVWPEVTVSPDSVYQAIASLRRQLGDDPKQPAYIATVPRLGYRMVATVAPWEAIQVDPKSDASIALASELRNKWPPKSGITFAVAAICLTLAVAFLLFHRSSDNRRDSAVLAPQNSIAVLPFLDLTEGMKEEEFADGMTEELIGRLSKIPGLRVPPPTSSFYFKGKQLPLADIARSLGVAYVLDGSVRKSGGRLRVAARLVRADSGYVIWTETYDRPFTDILMVQDDIAGEVTKALKTSIAPQSGPPVAP
jgi:transcriptional activator of cad operon